MTSATMNGAASTTWYEANQSYLALAFSRLYSRLEYVLSTREGGKRGNSTANKEKGTVIDPVEWKFSQLPALEQLCSSFELSNFERDVLLLCAGVEMDVRVAELIASLNSNRRLLPTFSLALTTLNGAHWSALSPVRALRYWQLIELHSADTLVSSPLRINERILHYIAGVPTIDERLQGLVYPLPQSDMLPSSYGETARKIAAIWTEAAASSLESSSTQKLPIVELCGNEPEAKRAIAAKAAALLNLQLYVLNACNLPQSFTAETNLIIRLWEREAILGDNALMLEIEDRGIADASSVNTVFNLLEVIHSPLILSTHQPYMRASRPRVVFHTGKPTRGEQASIWNATLAGHNVNGMVETIVSQFSLAPTAIRSAAHRADGTARESGPFFVDFKEELWNACRTEGRHRLEGLAQRIETTATWDDLVLLEKDKESLRRIVIHVRHRTKIYETWGFAAKSSRGLGITALFAGASGTGKTMAAEVLAHELRLDLFRIDLSQVVSKYIGETEKNLGRVFDAAEASASVLLFDEADALFGKRSDVKDSHDRYANIEVSYLLQRMEAYRGLAILTTNRKNALDHAFLRRIRFVLDFPFPATIQRAEMWRRAFPQNTPTEDLRIDRLAQLHVAGGNIQNIAMGAAFLAAEAEQPVRMEHVLSSARSEFAKLESPLSDMEVSGWV